MKVAFHLHRRPPALAQPPEALLLPSADSAEVLALLAALGHDPLPDVHTVATGFLIIPEQTISNVPVGVVALQRLGLHLYLPVDAALVPPLLADEASGLTRERGLVFLPGGAVLSFDPTTPLPLSALLSAGAIRRPEWQPFPARPPLADRLREVLLDRPEDNAAAVIERDDVDVGTEGPAPTGVGQSLRDQARYWTGQLFLKLGNALGMKGLAGYGAALIAQAPRLTRGLLGRQEAALRNLLKELREGDAEQALRRAVPVLGEGSRGQHPSTADQLPTQNLDYSLGALFGSGRGPGGVWLGGANVQQELIWEYRKAAQLAVQRGDHRRAAMIYARLLHDYRSAAAALERGGLFHDAGLLYLEKVGDARAAAQAFASAGEIDRAVQLYRQEGCFAESGDLLKQAGEDDEALRDYRLAAEKLIESPLGLLAAGELILKRASRPDVAREYFLRGWPERPEPNAPACGLHLARLYASSAEPDALLLLTQEADELFATWGADAVAVDFYSTVVKLADLETLTVAREEVRDRARMSLAARLRRSVGEPGCVVAVSGLLGSSGVWSAAVVSDARHAVLTAAQQVRPEERRPGAPTWLRLAEETVTAACQSLLTGDLFVGLRSGRVVWFCPDDGRVMSLPHRGAGTVHSLTVAPDGKFVVAGQFTTEGVGRLVLYNRSDRGFDLSGTLERPEVTNTLWLTPTLTDGEGSAVFAMWDGRHLDLYGPGLRFWRRLRLPLPAEELTAVLLLPAGLAPEPTASPVLTASASFPPLEPPEFSQLLFVGDTLWAQTPSWTGRHMTSLGWTFPSWDGELRSPPVWQMRDRDHVELLGLNADGAVCWSLLLFGNGLLHNLSTRVTRETGYRAATLVRAALVAAVAPGRVDWLRVSVRGFSLMTTTWLASPQAIACFVSQPTNELLIVCDDGQLVRVPIPG